MAVLVDDQEESLLYADRLTNSGLPCKKLKPMKQAQELVSAIRREKYDVVLLDYRLDDSNEVAYRGGTVAAQLKEALPDIPVVLLTSEAKLRQSLEHNPQIYGLFDLKLLKEELRKPEQWKLQATRIRDLAMGYREIATGVGETSKGTEAAVWSTLAKLLGATQAEEQLLPQFCQGPAPTRTTEVARWLSELRSFPGALIDAAHVRALFGLNELSFKEPAVQKALQKGRYIGVFSELEQRWWRSRVSELLRTIAREQAMGTAQERVAALSKKVKKPLKADQCVVCEGGNINQVCHICRAAADPGHVVRAVVDARPAWADSPLVCFQCIRTGRAEQVRFASGTEGLIEELHRGGAAEH
ncbi:response regulator [Archangium lansingense]|uniref:response regulator n=1 Tax=Archangium lansingense TaxID=2995310 RepID=UPI003B7BD1BF